MRIPGFSARADWEALPWRTTRDPGIRWLPLASDGTEPGGDRRASGAVLVWMAPGCGYRPHRHVGTEDVLVLRGGYRDAEGEHREGDHVHYPAGSSHAPVALGDPDRPAGPDNPACILFSVVPEGIEVLGH
jgi:anti-sigma factor ChrR (cupin superfamily)